MSTFSERYGYVPRRTTVITESMPTEIANAICSCLDDLRANYDRYMHCDYTYLERQVWRYFLNRRSDTFSSRFEILFRYIELPQNNWFNKLDLIEFVIEYILQESKKKNNPKGIDLCGYFVQSLNQEFERLYYGYRIVNYKVVPITSEMEIEAIEKAYTDSKDNIRVHLSEALKLFSDREHPDFRNSIKESISAVEALCRELTDENTLGKALKCLEEQGIIIQTQLKESFTKLYAYTNQGETGIRHCLMEDDGTYHPTYNEAYFMLITCSAFVNYLRGVVGMR